MLILPSNLGFFIMLALGILVNTLLIGNHIAMLLAIRKHNRQVADAVSAPQQQLSVVTKTREESCYGYVYCPFNSRNLCPSKIDGHHFLSVSRQPI